MMCLISTRLPRDTVDSSYLFEILETASALTDFLPWAPKRRISLSAVMYYFFMRSQRQIFFVPPFRGLIFASQRQILFSSVTTCLIPTLASQRQILLMFLCISLPLDTRSIFLLYLVKDATSKPILLLNWWSRMVQWNNHLFLVIWRSAVQILAVATYLLRILHNGDSSM